MVTPYAYGHWGDEDCPAGMGSSGPSSASGKVCSYSDHNLAAGQLRTWGFCDDSRWLGSAYGPQESQESQEAQQGLFCRRFRITAALAGPAHSRGRGREPDSGQRGNTQSIIVGDWVVREREDKRKEQSQREKISPRSTFPPDNSSLDLYVLAAPFAARRTSRRPGTSQAQFSAAASTIQGGHSGCPPAKRFRGMKHNHWTTLPGNRMNCANGRRQCMAGGDPPYPYQ